MNNINIISKTDLSDEDLADLKQACLSVPEIMHNDIKYRFFKAKAFQEEFGFDEAQMRHSFVSMLRQCADVIETNDERSNVPVIIAAFKEEIHSILST